jgi:hypothetical protein
VVGSPGWHLAFLAGTTAAASALALLRDARRPATWALLAAGVTAVALGIALQFS